MAAKKKNGKKQKSVDPVVELHLPSDLYAEAMKVAPETLDSVIRSIFGSSEIFQRKTVHIVEKKSATVASSGPFAYRKTCSST